MSRTRAVPIVAQSTITVNDRWLSFEQARAYIHATNWRMEELRRAGNPPYILQGKRPVYDRADLDAYMEANKVPAKTEAVTTSVGVTA
jgi:hypothetical protein